MTQTDSQLSFVSFPLPRDRDERFAQLYALGIPPLAAARAAGFDWNGTKEGNEGNARRLAQRPRIRGRIAYWRHNRDAQVQLELRRLIESRLLLWHETDIGDYYEERQEPFLDPKGNPVLDGDGNPIMKVVQRLKPFSELSSEQRRAIKSLTYTERGRPNLELYSALDANRDLRKMNGFDAAIAPEDKPKSAESETDALINSVLELTKRINSLNGADAENIS